MGDFGADSARLTVRGANNLSLGQGGRTFTNDTVSVVASVQECDFYHTIVCLTDTVFTSLTDLSKDGNTETGVTFVAGTSIFGVITEYQLTSGSVHAYKALNANTGGE